MNSVWLLLFVSLANYGCYGHEEEDQICFKVPPVSGNCGCLLNNNEVCLNLPHTSARGQCDPGQCNLFKTTVDLTQIGHGSHVQVPNPLHVQQLNKQQQEIGLLKSQLAAVTKQLSDLAAKSKANQAVAQPKAAAPDAALVKTCDSYNGKIYNGKCYFIIEKPLTGYPQALKKCQEVNASASLAELRSDKMLRDVSDLLRPSSLASGMENFYIGGKFSYADRTFTYPNGDVVKDTDMVWGSCPYCPNPVAGATAVVIRIYPFHAPSPQEVKTHIATAFYDIINAAPSSYTVRVICQV